MTKYIYKISLLVSFLFAAQVVWGNLPTSGAISGTYTLTKDITLDGVLTVALGKTATINLNGHTINRNGNGPAQYVFIVKGTLNLQGNGIIKGGRGDRGGCALISGTVVLDGPTIQDCIATDNNYDDTETTDIHYFTQGCGGAFFINQGGALYFKSGTIKNCKTEKTTATSNVLKNFGRGGAVFVDAESGSNPGYFEMSGSSSIINCSASVGGAVYVHKSVNTEGNKVNGSFVMKGGTIKNNKARYGTAVFVYGSFDMSGGSITENKTDDLNSTWSYPTGNNLPDYGNSSGYGAIYTIGEVSSLAKFNMTGGTISKNVSSSGGGVMVWTNSEFTMEGTYALITENYAVGNKAGGGLGNGGAVYVQNGTFNLKGGQLTNNRAVRYGGAVNTNESATFKISGITEISGNIANHGGGFSQEQGECSMSLDGSGIQIKGNIAKTNGGGLMIEKGSLYINNATISGNSAGSKGGGVSFYVYRIEGDVQVDVEGTSIISNNKANVSGGGIDIYVSPNTEEKDKSAQLDGNADLNSVFANLKSGNLNNNSSPIGAGINIYIKTETNATGSTNAATVTLGTNKTSATIYNNMATDNGGGIAMNSGTFNILNAKFSYNSATSNGGGMYLGDGTFNISGETDLFNNSANNGGGIYVGNGTFTVSESGSIIAITNHVTNDGGAICLSGGNISSMGYTLFKGNYSGNYGGAVYVSGGNISLKSPIIDGNGKKDGVPTTKKGGAIYLTGSGKSFTSTGTETIENNASTEAGGAIYVNGGSVNMGTATLLGNNSKCGGAAYVLSGNVTTTGTTSITNNYATTDGGAVYVSGGSVSLKNPIITGNGKNGGSTVTSKGGAIYSTGTVTFNGPSTINSNSAMNGGAIYTTGTVTLKGSSTMEGNIATGDGGVMFVDGGDILSTDGRIYYSVTAKNNSAFNGGAFRVNGSIDFGYTLMQNNTASGNGGAVALYNGTFKMKNDDGAGNNSTISGNTATNGLGGGLYINNTSSSQAKITWDGGVFTGNEAKAGGAVAAEGSIDLTFAATVENNKAEIGGGLYMNNGVDMKFGAGLVRGNSAAQPETDTKKYTTARNLDANSVSGVGGGIFMSNNSTLEFTASDKLGIYNNFATNAGADICANGSSTSIILPDVSNMKLTGFDVPASRLDWMEDYFNDESYISNRTSLSSKNQTGIRYEELLKVFLDGGRNIEDYMVDIPLNGTRSFNNYICLDLGYDLVYVDLTVIGLKDGDYTEIICNYPKDGNPTQYSKLLFKNEDTKQIALPKGYWQFVASDWSNAYNKPSIKAGNAEPTYYDGYVFISNTKDGTDHDAAGKEVQAYKKINVEFNPLDESNPKSQVKQFQKVIVNRMMRKN